MMVLQQVKDGVKQRKRLYKDLSFALDMPYSTLSRIINGFDRPPINFNNRVNCVFKLWDNEEKLINTDTKGKKNG